MNNGGNYEANVNEHRVKGEEEQVGIASSRKFLDGNHCCQFLQEERVSSYPENCRCSNYCMRNSSKGFRTPPRPFRKARYSWEIKNYEFTLNRIVQRMRHASTHGAAARTNSEEEFACPNQCMKNSCPTLLHYSNMNDLKYRSSNGHYNNSVQVHSSPPYDAYLPQFPPTSYQAQYGAIMNASFNQHSAMLSSNGNPQLLFEQGKNDSSVEVDPDTKLIRWHTRQLCRSIFDNTVNRMLENMGFSPLPDRPSAQNLHPLLMLNLPEDEARREVEELRQRTLETQALSVALQQRGLLPQQLPYDHIDSATNSECETSEDESEVADDSNMELPPSQFNAVDSEVNQYDNIMSVARHYSSLSHMPNKSLFPTTQGPYMPPGQHPCCHDNLCDDKTSCDSHSSLKAKKEKCDKADVEAASELCSEEQDNSLGHSEELPAHREQTTANPKCRSRECLSGDGNSCKRIKTDDNENCIPDHHAETIIQGKVEQVAYSEVEQNGGLKLNPEALSESREGTQQTESYFSRNSMYFSSLNQQDLGYQKA